MTKVNFISGPNLELGTVAEPRWIPYGKMTDGEMRMALLAEQLNIVGQYYQSDEHLASEREIIAALESGISRSGGIKLPGQLASQLSAQLAKAKTQSRPAAGQFTAKRDGYRKMGVGNPLIESEDCNQFRGNTLPVLSDGAWDGQNLGVETPEYFACLNRKAGINLLNTHLEKSSHHLLYEFVQPTETSVTVLTKRVLHQAAVSKLAQITNVDPVNMKLWLRNGIMRNNAAKGADPIQPEDTIDTLRASAQQGIGLPFLALLPAILACIGAAVGAAASMVNSVQATKREELRLTAQAIGTPSFGPGKNDFLYGGGGSGQGNGNAGGGSGQGNGNAGGGSDQNNDSEESSIITNLFTEDNLPILLLAAAGGVYAITR